ncbi:transcriptional regulator, LysR family [Thalassospira xiamenensis]|uniref:Transcriptional regulator, LysR family n=2 Tax=Thalassospira xiamenensis TaxID=220697 RepID=A0A285TZI2_9PROT|nr:transcriptional regulator, LysR family [Thalassospira xiamenensis]
MDLASLAVFRTVAKEQGITRAAELLGRVPSNVTTRVQQLETEIGVALFQRDKKRMILTQEGETFLEYADRILNLADEARQVVNPSAPAGTLRVGSMESTVASRLPVLLAAYNKAFPDVTIELSTAPTRQLVDGLLARRIDCALIAIPSGEWWLEPGTLDTRALFREELVLLLPPGHPDILSASDIQPKSLAAFAPGCTYRTLAEEWLTGFGSIREHFAVQEVGSYHAMFACTAAGSCISIMPRSVVDLMRHLGPVREHPLMTVDTFLACRPGFDTPAFSEFRKTLETASDIKK